jgi:transcriptional regulator of arginine metabolism
MKRRAVDVDAEDDLGHGGTDSRNSGAHCQPLPRRAVVDARGDDSYNARVPTKAARHDAILRLVGEEAIGSQHELASALRRAGIRVSQGTLSRDIRELGLVKGRHGYRVLRGETAPLGGEASLRRLVREFLLSSTRAGNLLVLKTPPGSANTLGEAIDEAGWSELAGTLAGDDTLLCIARTPALARQVQARLRRLSP